jgi:hypothetical protein
MSYQGNWLTGEKGALRVIELRKELDQKEVQRVNQNYRQYFSPKRSTSFLVCS